MFASSIIHAEVQQVSVSPATVQEMSQALFHTIRADGFIPDLIVGVSRGGLAPLAYLAGDGMFSLRQAVTVSVQSYEKDHQGQLQLLFPIHFEDLEKYKSILIVDDLADSGKTFVFVTSLFKEKLKNATIKTAALYYKPSHSIFKPDYYVAETADWIVFPWE